MKKLDYYISRKQRVLLFLSGGSVVRLYGKLGQYIQTLEPSFDALCIVQVDERYHPVSRKDSNASAVKRCGLYSVLRATGVPYHEISQEKSFDKSSADYNQTISGIWNGFEKHIAILGIGADGHTAGLLPGFQKAWDVDQFIVGYKNDGKFPQRISLTPKILQELDYALVVAVGEEKKDMVKKFVVCSVKEIDKMPAIILHRIKSMDLFSDVL